MEIGQRLKAIREQKNLSQGDIEKRTSLLRCYVSRVENGFTVPNVETLEKFARALEVPLYQLFYDGDNPPAAPKITASESKLYGTSGKAAREVMKFRRLMGRMEDRERNILLSIARMMVRSAE